MPNKGLHWLTVDAANICELICTRNRMKGRELWVRICRSDVDAARTTMFIAPNPARGRIVRVAYQQNVPVTAFRVMLQDAWDHDWVIRAAIGRGGRRRMLKAWFERATFDVSHLPDTVTVYRGGTIPPRYDWSFLRRGYAWTLKLETAKFFACRFPHLGEPIIVRATVPRALIKAHITSRNED